jgi:alkanesulfonate monooxygenase SsuD/methylene tetrahydromethanopterin reductase-like flavin-dependent oxidoreductase (luciferase family)
LCHGTPGNGTAIRTTLSDMLESWITISVLAGITSKIKLGTMMTGVIYRHRSILAKIGATLDLLSKGRLFMGIGAAWNEEESLAYGIPFPSIKERFVRLEEAIQIVRKMWTDEPSTSFNGRRQDSWLTHCHKWMTMEPLEESERLFLNSKFTMW